MSRSAVSSCFKLWLAIGLLGLFSPALAQNALLQAGPTTPGHSPMYVSQGNSQAVVQDSGPAGGGGIGLGLAEQLLTVRGTGTAPYANAGTGPLGENWCDMDAPATNATGGHRLCISPNAQGGGLISYNAFGGAAALPLYFNVNGTQYQFPFSTSGVIGPSTTVVGDLAVWNNTTGTLLKDSNVLPSSTIATTQASSDNSTKVATTAFVQSVVTAAFNTICTVIPNVCTATFGYANAIWFGATGNGSTDDTTAIQNAWNEAATLGVNVWVAGGTSGVFKISSLTQPTPTGMGKSSFLTGPGASLVTLNSTVTGTTCAINVSGTYGVNTYLNGAFQGFTLQQSAQAQGGKGFCLTQIVQTTFRDVTVQYFSIGLQGVDSILLTFDNVRFFQNDKGMTGAQVSFSPPNAWNVVNGSHFINNKTNAIQLTGPNLLNVVGNEFESNGSNLAGTPATIDIVGPPGGPVVGGNISGNYFEANGNVEIRLNQNSVSGGVGVYNVTGNTFTRTLAGQVAGIYIINNASGGAQTTVNVGGNGFYDNFGNASGFQWLSVATSGTQNYTYNCVVSNHVDNSAEMPQPLCQNPAANSTLSVDSAGQYIGYLAPSFAPCTGAWTSASPPAPTASTGAFATGGNAPVVTWQYCQSAKTFHFAAQLVLGAASVGSASGNWQFSLPNSLTAVGITALNGADATASTALYSAIAASSGQVNVGASTFTNSHTYIVAGEIQVH